MRRIESSMRSARHAKVWFAIVAVCLGTAAMARDAPADPLNSPAWNYVQTRFFADHDIVFDERVKVVAPANAEDPLDVPVLVSAEGLSDVEEIVIVADLNPIQKILAYRPTRALPELAFRFKVEQSTPIRAAMLTKDGVWHIGGVWLSAAGGGCTTPSGGSAGLWQSHLGELNARLWVRADNSQRLRLRVIHPMDTGLANGIPAFYIDRITIRDAKGAELANLQTFEPVSENPVISLDLKNTGPVRIDGHDIQGNTFAAEIRP